jgi:hypothetical protein
MISLISLIWGLGGQELLVIFLVLFVGLFPIYYMIKILLSEYLPTNTKILWVLAIFALSFIGLIAFYFSDDYDRMKGEYV